MLNSGPHDAIHIEGLELSVRIGVPDEERGRLQRLTVSMTLWPLEGFGRLGDDVANAVNYANVCDEVRSLALQRTDKLIETLAESIAAHLLSVFSIRRVRVELRKFILPDVKHVAVILTRERAPDL